MNNCTDSKKVIVCEASSERRAFVQLENVKIDTSLLITHTFPLSRINEAYKMFENKEDRVIKVAIENQMFLNEDYNRLVYKLYCFRSAQMEII